MSSQSDKVYAPGGEVDPLRSKMDREYLARHREFSTLSKKSFILSEQVDEDDADIEDVDLQQSLARIEREENMKKLAKSKNIFSTNYWSFLVSRNIDYFSITIMELNSLLITYPLLTIKTRVQAKHRYEDVSYFLKNKVDKHSLFSGISQGLMSVFVGNTISINVFRLAYTTLANRQRPDTPLQLGWLNMQSHALADLASLPFRHIFDIRRMYSQMNNTDRTLTKFLTSYYKTFPAALFRDLIFRLTYNISNQSILYGKYYYYYYTVNANAIDFSDYERRISFDQRAGAMIASTFLAGFLSNPFDVVVTKIITQQYEKYTGIMDCFRKVRKEETLSKLFFSGFSARSGFYAANGLIVLQFYGTFREMMHGAYSI